MSIVYEEPIVDKSKPKKRKLEETKEKSNKREKKEDGNFKKEKKFKRSESHDDDNEEISNIQIKDDLKEIGEETMAKEGDLSKFKISESVKSKMIEKGIKYLFPIQYKTFNQLMDGKDLIGRARTGSGKTLAFGLPIVEKLIASPNTTHGRPPRVLILAPTRELAKQIAAELSSIAPKISITTVYGGAPYDPQERAMRKGIDVVVGTPGRIIDHIDRENLVLSNIQYLVMDEADEMLSFGFQEAIERILSSIPENKNIQTLLFSATVPPWVHKVAEKYMKKDRITIDLVGKQKYKSATTIQHYAIKCEVTQSIINGLVDIVKVYAGNGRTIIFVDTKSNADNMATNSSVASICQSLHGDIKQSQREIILQGFKDGKFPVLVATDVAARGLDIPSVDLVINLKPPMSHEAYIHRVGRTGRAGRSGVAITFFGRYTTDQLLYLEQKVGLEFKRIGFPSRTDLVAGAKEIAIEALNDVHPEMIKFFEADANKLIEEMGASKVVAAALACLSGYKKAPLSRSMLSGMEGFVTLKLVDKVYTITGVLKAIDNIIQSRQSNDVGEIKLWTDGAFVDVRSQIAPKLVEQTQKRKEQNPGRAVGYFEYVTELPDMQVEGEIKGNNNFGNDRRGSFGRGNFGQRGGDNFRKSNGHSNGYGGKSNGFGQRGGDHFGKSNGFGNGKSNGFADKKKW